MTVVARNEVAPWRRGLDGVIVFPPDATDPLWLAAPGDTIFELTASPAHRGTLIDEVVASLRRRPETDPFRVGVHRGNPYGLPVAAGYSSSSVAEATSVLVVRITGERLGRRQHVAVAQPLTA